jgi:hypothetical protein
LEVRGSDELAMLDSAVYRTPCAVRFSVSSVPGTDPLW